MTNAAAYASTERLVTILKEADKSYTQLPHNIMIAIEALTQSLSEYGQRRTMRAGAGMRIQGPDKFNWERHDPRRRHALLSARAGEDMVIERERELRQHVYFWRMSGPNMSYPAVSSGRPDKQACADVMMLSAAMAVAASGDYVGVLGGTAPRTGSRVSGPLLSQIESMVDQNGITPFHPRRVPRHSVAVLIIDALATRPKDLEQDLKLLRSTGMSGHVIAVQDLDELTFPFSGHRRFVDPSGTLKIEFQKAENRRDAYLEKAAAHLRSIRDLCSGAGFSFTLQSTDRPLHNGLMPLFGLEPQEPAATTALPGGWTP